MYPKARSFTCVGGVVMLLALSGCELTVDSRPSRTPTTTIEATTLKASLAATTAANITPAPTLSVGGPDTIDRDLALDTAYASNFRTSYPQYAAGFSDAELATNGVKICVYLTEIGVEPLVYKRRIQHAYERGTVRPSEDDVRGISEVSIQTICPELNDELETIMRKND